METQPRSFHTKRDTLDYAVALGVDEIQWLRDNVQTQLDSDSELDLDALFEKLEWVLRKAALDRVGKQI